MLRKGTISVLLVIALQAAGQFTGGQFNITGRIVDAETLEPLPFAHVFIDQTTIGVVSDIDGNYIFEGLKPGDYKLVFSFVGYDLYQSTAAVIDKNLRISVRMVPSQTLLGSLEVKGTRDKDWEKQLRQFERVFFGDNPFSRQCKILNPEVLDFRIDGDRNFRAVASAPLNIENAALGYKIMCTLSDFMANKKEYRINGLFKFDELNTMDPKQALAWSRARKLAYQNSLRFLFKSIIEQHEAENGFLLFKDNQSELKRPTSGYFADALGKDVFQVNLKDAVTPTGKPGFYRISVDGRIEVHHTTSFASQKAYKDVAYPVSWLEFKKDFALVSQDGNLVNANELVTMGELNINRVANMLPRDYHPGNMVVVNYLTKRKMARRLQEKVYVHTDKSWYYPGGKVWFKAYAGYANQSVRDSLSRVLYADLVDARGEVLISRIVKLEHGAGHGDFVLPSGLAAGTYFLRAYTNWMRNYGTASTFSMPIYVAAPTERLNPVALEKMNSDLLMVSGIKSTYLISDSIKLTLGIDTAALSHADISISVTETSQAFDIQNRPKIGEVLFFEDELPQGALLDFIYPIEYGITVDGKVIPPKRKSSAFQLTVIQGNMDSLFSITTDRAGRFRLSNLHFQDSVDFAFQSRNKRGQIVGTSSILARNFPAFEKPKSDFVQRPLERIKLNVPVFIDFREKKDTLKRAVQPPAEVKHNFNTYLTNPNTVFSEQDLKKFQGAQNIFQTLIGRVSGLQINNASGQLYFRQNARSLSTANVDALLVIDGIPQNMIQAPVAQQVNSNVSEVKDDVILSNKTRSENTEGQTSSLSDRIKQQANRESEQVTNYGGLPIINVEEVSHVEVSSTSDPRFGHQGVNGVIAVFTKRAQGKESSVKTTEQIKLCGFNTPSTFIAENEVQVNGYVPTIYWNPNVSFGKDGTILGFKSPAIPGKYIVTIKGIGNDGSPVSGYFDFEVVQTSLGQRQK